eukprot:502485-Hanusia_phi.AAC.7
MLYWSLQDGQNTRNRCPTMCTSKSPSLPPPRGPCQPTTPTPRNKPDVCPGPVQGTEAYGSQHWGKALLKSTRRSTLSPSYSMDIVNSLEYHYPIFLAEDLPTPSILYPPTVDAGNDEGWQEMCGRREVGGGEDEGEEEKDEEMKEEGRPGPRGC